MAKASLKLLDGTTVDIEGSAEEIKNILTLHNYNQIENTANKNKPKQKVTVGTKSKNFDSFDITEIVNEIKNCEDAELIGKNILDRTSQVDRILLPLHISEQYLKNKPALTTGDISRILNDLSIHISTANVAHTLSGTASKYVIGDKVRKKGQPVKYKLSRRGQQYLEAVIKNKAD